MHGQYEDGLEELLLFCLSDMKAGNESELSDPVLSVVGAFIPLVLRELHDIFVHTGFPVGEGDEIT